MNKETWDTVQANYWSSTSENYDSLYSNQWSLYEDLQLVDALKATDMNLKNALDLGCGTGFGYETLNKNFPDVNYTGIDVSGQMLEKFKNKHGDVNLRCAPMDTLGTFEENQFSFVMSLNSSFSYAFSPEELLTNMYKVLQYEGKIFLSVLNHHSLRRLVRFQFKPIEKYQTRGCNTSQYCWARVFSQNKFYDMLEKTGFKNINFIPQSVLAGVIEKKLFINLDKFLVKNLPHLSHVYHVVATK